MELDQIRPVLMERDSVGGSFLEKVLARMRRSDHSLLGHWQRMTHRLLSGLERSRLLRGYSALWREQALPIDGARPEPAIKLDSVFFMSLTAHVVLLLLLAWVSVQAKPSLNDAPIRVNIMDAGRQSEAPRAESRQPAPPVAKKAPPKAKTRARPKKVVRRTVTTVKPTVRAPKSLPKPTPSPAPLPSPTALPAPKPLPAPKVLAGSPIGQQAEVSAPGDPLVRLPTTQTTPGISASDLAVGANAGSNVTADIAGIPKELMHGKANSGRRTGRQSLQRADVGAYLKAIQERVKAVWRYPSGVRGVHQVNFSIVLDRAGTLVSVRVLDSSNAGLNQSATEAVKLAAPFPPMSQDLQWLAGQPISLRFKVNVGGIR